MEPRAWDEAILDLFSHQRACRHFRPEPVDDATVAAVLDAACRAPSAGNSQPWVFVVVRDPERRARIWELAERAWAGGGRDASADLAPELLAEVDAGLTGGCAGAPVTIVVGGDTARCDHRALEASVFPAIQNLLLAATARGLGSALTTIATAFADELAHLVELPARVTPLAVVPLGHPVAPLGRSRREPAGDHTHRERFGIAW